MTGANSDQGVLAALRVSYPNRARYGVGGVARSASGALSGKVLVVLARTGRLSSRLAGAVGGAGGRSGLHAVDEVGRPRGKRIDRGLSSARRYGREDRGIHHSKPAHTVDPKLRVDDGQGVGAETAGADGMELSGGVAP